MPPRKKFQSKRLTTKKRVKIEKKVREHHKKARKALKNKLHRKGNKKDPGIPKSFPMKEEFLGQLQIDKEDERVHKSKSRNLAQLLLDASKRSEEFESSNLDQNESKDQEEEYDPSKKSYARELNRVIEISDVILEVLDARDPENFRSSHLEEQIIKAGKKLVLVLNKADLIPQDILGLWISHLKQFHPVIAFSNVQFGKLCCGDELLQLLKNYSRNETIKTCITVGLAGYPNVGKSSIINALKRSKVCQAGSTPGTTRAKQLVHLDKNIRLLDSPGVVFSTSNSSSHPSTLSSRSPDNATNLLKNCIQVEKISDPTSVILKILEKGLLKNLIDLYELSMDTTNIENFLVNVAIKKGKLIKGGRPNLEETARIIIRDWNQGKISYFVPPPVGPVADPVVLDRFSPEFKLNNG